MTQTTNTQIDRIIKRTDEITEKELARQELPNPRTQTNTTQNKEELESQKFLVIHSNKLSTKETKVPKDFIPLFIREYSGKDGEQVFIKDHLIANSKKESWEEIQQRERFQQTLEFLFDASRGQKQVFLEELSILWAKELSQAHQSGIEEERKRIRNK